MYVLIADIFAGVVIQLICAYGPILVFEDPVLSSFHFVCALPFHFTTFLFQFVVMDAGLPIAPNPPLPPQGASQHNTTSKCETKVPLHQLVCNFIKPFLSSISLLELKWH